MGERDDAVGRRMFVRFEGAVRTRARADGSSYWEVSGSRGRGLTSRSLLNAP